MRLWEANTGKQFGAPFFHEGPALCLCFSPDSGRIAVGTLDGEVVIWDIHSAKRVPAMMRHSGYINHLEFSGDGLMLVSTAEDGTTRLWDGHSGLPLASPLRHSRAVRQARLSPDGLHLVTVSGEKGTGEGFARLWDAGLFFPKSICLHHTQPVEAVAFSRSGGSLATGSRGTIVSVWDSLNGTALRPSSCIAPGFGRVTSLQFSANDRELCAISVSGGLTLWNSDTARPRLTIDVPGWAESACLSRDGMKLVVAAHDGIARIYSTAEGALSVTNQERHSGWLLGAEFSPDGIRFVTFSTDGFARVWDAGNGRPMTEPLRHDGIVRTAVFDGTGKLIATGTEDGTSRIWNTATGELLATVHHDGPVVCVAFDRQSQRLATASWDHTARLWDVRTGKPLTPPLRHEDRVATVEFSPDDHWVVTASADHTARIWDARVGLPVTRPLRHLDGVNAARFSPDGNRLVTIADDATARLWELPPRGALNAVFLAKLAEAITMERIEDDGSISLIPFSEIQSLRSNLLNTAESEPLRRFATWVMAERTTRTLTPVSTLTIPEYVGRLLAQEERGFVEEAVRVAPTNARALSRLALVSAQETENPRRMAEATLYFSRAVRFGLSFREAEHVGASLAELGIKTTNVVTGLEAVERALALTPGDPDLWLAKGRLLAATDRLEEARQAFSRSLDLASGTNAPEMRIRREALAARASVLQRLGRRELAQADLQTARGLYPRLPGTPTYLIDLSAFYNAGFNEDWHNRREVGNNLAFLPTGVQEFAGTKFDLRGIVQLSSTTLMRFETNYPVAVSNIGVGQACRQLHFLVGIGWRDPKGMVVGQFVMRLADGSQEPRPLVYGVDARNWGFVAGTFREAGTPEPAWKGPLERSRMAWPEEGCCLYKVTWQNPRPKVKVESLDFISSMSSSAPFLMAVTAEE